MRVPEEIKDVVARGGLFVVNHSAGKDSQAMLQKVLEVVPPDQVVVIHANLGRVEWNGVVDHIVRNSHGLPLIVCSNERKDFLEMVERRGMFPSPQQRQCTSDLKRGPIEREIRRHLKANPRFGGLVVNCMGMRKQESANRAKLTDLKRNEGNSIAGREWYDWLPIHDMLIDEVWATIRDAGQEPHPAYAAGMSRLSCRFCIMASDEDLATAARLSPELYREYVMMERRIGRTMMMPRGGVAKTLEEITGVPLPPPATVRVEVEAFAPTP